MDIGQPAAVFEYLQLIWLRSCANVSILLYRWWITYRLLFASTPNDGSQTIAVPANITTTARVSTGSRKYLLRYINTNFTIQSGSAVLSVLNTDPLSSNTIAQGRLIQPLYGDGPANAKRIYHTII
jgi:hypothetical protein